LLLSFAQTPRTFVKNRQRSENAVGWIVQADGRVKADPGNTFPIGMMENDKSPFSRYGSGGQYLFGIQRNSRVVHPRGAVTDSKNCESGLT